MDLEEEPGGLPRHTYDVFISFRGEDTRATFVAHLYSALCDAGIIVFKDDFELPKGNRIKTEQLQAIGSSKIAIINLSREYAASKWCLEELSIIMEFHKSKDHVVIPIFYSVEPVEVRNQKFSFGAAFQDLIKRISPTEDQVSRWRMALHEAGSISGFIVPILGSRDEREIVKEVVEDVIKILNKKVLVVAEYPVGVENRIQEVITMLQNCQSEDVVMVGILGMGGVGKTTIAKAVYNKIGHKFEGRSYISKIREVWDTMDGPVNLQNQLLSEICDTSKIKINSIESGKVILKDRLRQKTTLVVLDDVDRFSQLNALVGSHDWFKSESTVLITTRNKHLLHQMGCIYMVKNLDVGEAIELFSWHAFKQGSPKEDFVGLSIDVVAYSGGLPLALKVLGSYLFGREAKEWESLLEKLKKFPNDKIQKKLKISFDSLDDVEKEIFLDISCFFNGMDKNDVTQILDGCEFFASIGINTLIEQSLMTIDEKNMICMHGLLQDMGREIIREQSPHELEKRSRLWFHEDVLALLSGRMGTKAIEGLSLEVPHSEKMHFHTEAFKMMNRLRLLRLNNVQLSGDYKYISRHLRWLCWHGFPLKYIPSNFYQQKLVVIDLQYSSLRQVWKQPMVLKRLKILNLSHSVHLVQTPDFSKLPNLEKLILKDCPSLSIIHYSIGLLDKLLLLDLEDCIGLLSLPRSVYKLKCLKTLILSGCVKIEKLEADIEQMESLSILWDMPNYTQGPSTIPSGGPKQQSLLLEDRLNISDSLCGATSYIDISKVKNCLGHLLIQIGKNSEVFRELSEMVSQVLSTMKYGDNCILPDDNYPYWLTFKGEGASVKFKVPPVNGDHHLKGMSICCIYFSSFDSGNKACEFCIISLLIINYTKATTSLYKGDRLTSLGEERKEIISNLEPDDEVEVITIVGNEFTVNRTAIYLIYNESFDEQTEPSTAETTNLTDTKHKYDDEEEDKEAHQFSRPTKVRKT